MATMQREELVDMLEDLAHRFQDVMQDAYHALRALEIEDEGAADLARRTWFANIEMALNHDHTWLGGRTDNTLADTLRSVRGENEEDLGTCDPCNPGADGECLYCGREVYTKDEVDAEAKREEEDM